jgi:xylulokinase
VFLAPRTKIIRPALLWNDQRTVEQCREITGWWAENLLRTTGNVASPDSGPQDPVAARRGAANYSRVRTVLLPKDFIRLKLTGDRATDVRPSGTLLLDLHERDWSPRSYRRSRFARVVAPRP